MTRWRELAIVMLKVIMTSSGGLEAVAYPQLQGYWGNQARTRSLLGVGI